MEIGRLKTLLISEAPRAQSLLVTVLGDSVAPRDGPIWLEELIAMMAPFGMTERLVRTTVFRLSRDGWLVAERQGRRSQYRLTAEGAMHVEHAHRRIYAEPAPQWEGAWTFVIVDDDGVDAAARLRLRRALRWEGYGTASASVFVHPSRDVMRVEELLLAEHARARSTIFQGTAAPGQETVGLKQMAARYWPLEELAARYRAFVARFDTLEDSELAAASAQDAFVMRTLMVHAYRRVLLLDPQLPRLLLPAEWPADAAYQLIRRIYWRLVPPSESFLDTIFASKNPRSAGPAPSMSTRFPVTTAR